MTTARAPAGAGRLGLVALLLLLGTLWGGSFSVMRVATVAGAHPLGLSMWEGLGGALLVYAYLRARGVRPCFPRTRLRFFVTAGLGGIAIPSLCLFVASPHLPAGVLAMVVTLTSLFTYAIALPLRIDTLAWTRVAGIVLGFAGVLLIVLPRASLPDPAMVPWVLVGLVAPVCYAGASVYVALRSPPEVGSAELACGMLLGSALLMTPIALASGRAIALVPPWHTLEWATLGIVALAGVTRILYFMIITRAGPVFFSQVGYVVTLTGVLWGMALFGERHSLWVWAALALMLGGLTLVSPRRVEAGDA